MIKLSADQALPRDLVAAFYCSRTGKPFENAQLLNCPDSHTFSEQAVVELFGKMKNNGLCDNPGRCPKCSKDVTAYYPNTDLQRIVDVFFTVFTNVKPLPVYPLGSTKLHLHTQWGCETGVIQSDGAISFSLHGPTAGLKNPFDDTPEPQQAEISYVSVTIATAQKPEVSIAIGLHKGSYDNCTRLCEYFRAHGIPSFETTRESTVTTNKNISLEEYACFVKVLARTNNCDDAAKILFDKTSNHEKYTVTGKYVGT